LRIAVSTCTSQIGGNKSPDKPISIQRESESESGERERSREKWTDVKKRMVEDPRKRFFVSSYLLLLEKVAQG
jgi:hypothetical protein